MKTIIFRFTSVIAALAIGVGFFVLLLFFGNKSRGPLEDIFSNVSAQVAKTENRLMDTRERRSQKLEWFDAYRNNKIALNYVDTIILGAYDDNTYESYLNIISFEDSLKTKLPIISIYTAWGSKKDQVFPLLRAQAIYDLGSIPMITWEPWLNDFDPVQYPWNANAVNKNKGGLRAIAEGKYDAYIDKWAADAKRFGLPFYLRWGHEMNDPYRYPWGQQNNAPEDYIAAWQHVVKRFKAAGATNAIWIWSPHPAYPTYDQFYPGHEYVNWIGFTALNYGTVATWSQWWTFKEIINKAYTDLEPYGKPIMLSEFGSLKVGGDRAAWFKEALTSIPGNFPSIKAVVFFHAGSDITVTNKSLDWTFENDEPELIAVRESLNQWNKK
ncbi:MAG TPA: glycosyl hydrolase [Flavisolibacter sp.]|nr:glycosyl hydrolase [Flavisolibacter sp.]